jgi:hypothetical protein
MVLSIGSRAVDALKVFNIKNPTITVHTFKQLSAILDYHYYEPVVTFLESSKATVRGLAKVISTQQRDMWYKFHILHPEHTDNVIHPSRSMLHLHNPFHKPLLFVQGLQHPLKGSRKWCPHCWPSR